MDIAIEESISYVSHDGRSFPFILPTVPGFKISYHYYPVNTTVLQNSNLVVFQYLENDPNFPSMISAVRQQFRLKPLILVADSIDLAGITWSITAGINNTIILPYEYIQLQNLFYKYQATASLCCDTPQYVPRYSDPTHNWTPYNVHCNKKCKTIEAIKYIHTNHDTKISIELLSEKCHMSISTFNKTFKKEHGMTFSNYLKGMRIYIARKLLLGTQHPISDIADMCGFYDAAYFSKQFKLNEQKSPREYRAQVI